MKKEQKTNPHSRKSGTLQTAKTRNKSQKTPQGTTREQANKDIKEKEGILIDIVSS